MNEKSNCNTHTRRSAVRLCAVGRAKRRGGDNNCGFIIRDNFNGKRKAVRERDNFGEQNNNDPQDNNANPGGNHYNNECDHSAHSANVSDGENESGNYAGDKETACVGATGVCQGDNDHDNHCRSDYGTADGNHNSNADAERSDYDNKSYDHSETASNDKADHNNSTAYGDYDYEDHSPQAADHIKSDDNCYRKRHNLC